MLRGQLDGHLAAHGIANEMGLVDAELVQEVAEDIGAVSEAAALDDHFLRPTVLRHVDKKGTMIGPKGIDVAAEVAPAAGARPGAVDHDDRIARPKLVV